MPLAEDADVFGADSIRRLWRAFCLIACLGLTCAAPAPMVPSFESGNSLLSMCESVGESSGLCYGYMEGALDILAAYPQLATRLGVCFPAGISRRQVRDIGGNYLQSHPETRQNTAQSEMVLAFRTAFPCR